MNKNSPPFVPARKTRAFEDIAAQIRAELGRGGYAPGQRFASERELCETFKVSRNTLREALRSLENSGIIETRKGASGGAFVADVNGAAVKTALNDMWQMGSIRPEELMQARIWIETTIIRIAARKATKSDIAELKAAAEAGAAASAQGDFAESIRHGVRFHRALAACTRNQVMMTLMDALLEANAEIINTLGDYNNTFVGPDRLKFLKHFSARDAEQATATMERMLKKVQKIYVNMSGNAAAARTP